MIGYRMEGEREVSILASCEAAGWSVSGEEYPEESRWATLSETIRQARRRWALLGPHYRCTWLMERHQMLMDLSEDVTCYAEIGGAFDRQGRGRA